MHCMVDVAVRFSLRRQGRILMETMVVATRTLCLATRAKRGGTDEIRIMRLLLLNAMTSRELWTFRGLDSCFGSNMDVVHGRWRNAVDTMSGPCLHDPSCLRRFPFRES